MSNIRAVGYTAAQELCNLIKEADNGKVNVDASNIGVNATVDNSEDWGDAIGGGTVALNDKRLVTGGTVYTTKNSLESAIATNATAIAANTTAIETNTYDIANNKESIEDNTADIVQNTGGISANNKRITNIEKLLQGNLYDYQTDSTSAYTKSVPSGAMPYAGLEKVGGKTIVLNQIVKNGNFADTSNWSAPNLNAGSISASDNVLSYTIGSTIGNNSYTNIITQSMTFILNHKYYVAFSVKPAHDLAFIFAYLMGGGNNDSLNFGTCTGGVWQRKSIIGTKTAGNGNNLQLLCRNASVDGYSQGDVDQLKDAVVIDLTLMFGAGNEPSTVEEFEAMFPADYYEYNAGSLLSAGVTQVVSKDSNNATLQTYSIPTAIRNLEGYGWSAGTVYNYVDFERKVFVKNVGSITLDGTNVSVNSVASANNVYRYNTHVIISDGASNTTSISAPIESNPSVALSDPWNATSMCLGRHETNGRIYICVPNATITSVVAMNTWLQSNPTTIYYELATPIETDISVYITDDNLISVESGGTLTFHNSNGTDYLLPVPSTEEYMIDLQEAINNG